jgi:signal transduction histidine kinase
MSNVHSEHQGVGDGRLRPYYIACVIAAFGVLASVLLYRDQTSLQQRLLRTEFAQDASDRTAAIHREVVNDVEFLYLLAGYFDGSEKVERYEFHAFLEPILERHGEIRALAWVPRVPHQERESFARRITGELGRAYVIAEQTTEGELVPAAYRTTYFPVEYVEPGDINRNMLGFDLSSNFERREALERARDTGEIVVSSRIVLAEDWDAGASAFLAVFPVYAKHARLDNVGARRRALLGYVVGAFRVADVVEKALGYLEPAGISISMMDQTPDSGGLLLYRHEALGGGPLTPAVAAIQESARFDVGGRTWATISTPTPSYVEGRWSWVPSAVLFSALLVTGVLVAYAFVLMRQSTRIQALVQERTAELASANAHLREVDELKTKFLSNVSHELRTPLAAIISAAKIIRKHHETKPEAVVRFSDAIATEGERLGRLLNNFLDLTKIEAGAMDWNDDDVRVVRIVAQVVDSFGALSAEKGIELRQRIEPPELSVHMDRDRLVQVMTNLLNNAAKYTPHGGAITISVTIDAGDVLFAVQDTGPGIPAEEVGLIFDRYRQVRGDDGRMKKPGGTGLGLCICREIVEHYGGAIWVESRAGTGSVFKFTIPLPRRVSDESDRPTGRGRRGATADNRPAAAEPHPLPTPTTA